MHSFSFREHENALRIAFSTLSEDPGRPTGSLDFFQQTISGLVAHDSSNHYFILVSRTNRHLFDTPAPNKTLLLAGCSNEHRLRRILSEQWIVPRLLRKHRIDVLFTSSGGGVAPIWIPRNTRLVLAVYATQHLRGGLRIGLLRSLYRRWLALPSLRRASRVIVNSQTCLDEICSQIDIRQKAAVIFHGMDSRRYHSGPLDEAEASRFQRYGIEKPYVLFLSTIYFYKNVHTLVEAFGRLISATGLPHELVLVGRVDSSQQDGRSYLENLKAIARRHGVEDRLRFTGPVPAEDLRAFYKMADVYVQPSFYETFGKTVAEAFWCGCPVAGSRTAATPEVIGNAGLTFDPHDPEDLSTCLRRILLEPGLRSKLIEAGAQRAKLFSVEAEISKFAEVFAEAGGSAGGGKVDPERATDIPVARETATTAGDHRLLHVFSRYAEPGGEEMAVQQIAERLAGDRTDTRCIFENREWLGERAPFWLRQAFLMIRNPAAIQTLLSMHNALGSAAWVVHNVFPVGSAAIFREALRLRVPVIYYIHNFRPFSVNGYLWAGDELATGGLKGNFWKEIRRGAWQNSVIRTAWFAFVLKLTHRLGWFRSVKAWIAISDFMREKFIEAGVPAEDIFTIHHAWRPMPAPPEPRDGGYYVFLGRLIPAKGIRVLFEAWEILRRELGERAPRLVIGGGGPSEAWVREKTAENPLVEFRGNVGGEAKHELLAGCRAMIAPSIWWEPLGLVTYEAYDFAKPILAARSGGLTETVIHGRTGMLHEPGNAAELARQILDLDAAPERRMEMGRAGREWLLANTNEEDWRRKFERAVKHALRT